MAKSGTWWLAANRWNQMTVLMQLALMEHLGLLPQQALDEREAMLVRLEYACQENDFRNASGTP